MKIYLICPFSKPEFKQLVLQNFNQQEYKEKHLIVVENGRGVGSFEESKHITVLRSEKHQSIAKNTGLSFLRDIGADYWVTFDCDDYYGPYYLIEVISNVDKAPVIGKRCYYVRLIDGRMLRYNENETKPSYCREIWGATIGSWVKESPDFDIHAFNEESHWIKNFCPLKGVFNTGPDNFIHLRWKYGHITNRMSTFHWRRIKNSYIEKKDYPNFMTQYLSKTVYHVTSPLYDERRQGYLSSLKSQQRVSC